MRRAASALAAALACAALLGPGCAGVAGPEGEDGSSKHSLPSFAKPQAGLLDAAAQWPADGIPYRTLTREDFRGTTAPPQVAGHQDRLGAYTCGNVVPDAGMGMMVQQDPATGRFFGELIGVRYLAQMDPECSWWNPKPIGIPPEYLLQHEQIHFALVEIEARELARRVEPLTVSGATLAEARAALERALEAEMKAALERIVERNLAFDEDTSARYAPEAQQRWYERVQAELARGN